MTSKIVHLTKTTTNVLGNHVHVYSNGDQLAITGEEFSYCAQKM